MKLGIRILTLFFSVVITGCSLAQNKSKWPRVSDDSFNKKLHFLLREKVPFVSVDSLQTMALQDLIILDTRAKEEYDVSHIPGAIFVGPTFNAADVEQYEKEKTVVVYCSVGYRSEKYGAAMQKMGYDKVYNLYGGIFEWVNNGQVVTTEEGNTSNIHTYNSNWGKYVINPNSIKIH